MWGWRRGERRKEKQRPRTDPSPYHCLPAGQRESTRQWGSRESEQRKTGRMWCLERQDKRVLREEKQLTVLSTPRSHMNQAKYLNSVLCLVTQSCLALFILMDSHQASLSMGILQATILEWVAMPSSRGSSQPRNQPGVFYIAGVVYQLSYQGSPSQLYLMVDTNPAGFQECTCHRNRNNLFSDGFIFFITKSIISKFYLINFLKLVNLISFV